MFIRVIKITAIIASISLLSPGSRDQGMFDGLLFFGLNQLLRETPGSLVAWRSAVSGGLSAVWSRSESVRGVYQLPATMRVDQNRQSRHCNQNNQLKDAETLGTAEGE